MTFRSRATLETLFAPVDIDVEHPGLVSAYTQFEATRFNYHLQQPLLGSFRDRLETLRWYISKYTLHRKAPVPLSAAQIAFLNSPAPFLGSPSPLSIAAMSFALSEFETKSFLEEEREIADVCYWWCAERAPQIAFNDCLVTREMHAELMKPAPGQASLDYGLNLYLIKYAGKTPELTDLNPNLLDDRVVILAHALAACADRPRLGRFLPRLSVKNLLAIDSEISEPLLSRLFDWGLRQSNLADDFTGADLTRFILASLEGVGSSFEGRETRFNGWSGPSTAATLPNGMVLDGTDRGITIIGPLDAASGLGQATRLSAEVLQLGPLPVRAVDFSWDNPAPVGYSTRRAIPGPERPTAINLLHLNAESLPMAIAHLHPDIYRRSYNIGYFFWELSQIPRCQRLALQVVDEIWVASEYNRQIYAAHADVPVVNVGMAVEPLGGFERQSRAKLRLPPEAYLFLTTFDAYSFIERKNPMAAVRAFQRAFPPGGKDAVGLVIKTQNRSGVGDAHQLKLWSQIDAALQDDPRVILIDETLRYEELLALKACCNCYVSLHRSEGLGFGMIEAMQLGLPVIATGHGGNMDFMTSSTALAVRHSLIPVLPGQYIFVEPGSVWADPDVDHASKLMRQLVSDRGKGVRLGEAAALHVKTHFSPQAISRRYAERLQAIEQLIGDQPTRTLDLGRSISMTRKL